MIDEQEILEIFNERGGRIRGTDLNVLFINRSRDEETKRHFKKLVNKLAVPLVENDEKFLVLREEYSLPIRHPIKMESVEEVQQILPEMEQSKIAAKFGEDLKENNDIFLEFDEKSSITSRDTSESLSPQQSLASTVEENKISEKSSSIGTQERASRENSARPEAVDIQHRWLQSAVICDFQSMAKMLQSNPELVAVSDFSSGYTALHYAAKSENVNSVKLLAGTFRADVNRRTRGGYTPLHLAVMHDQRETAELLIKVYKANPDIRDNSGRLPDHYINNRLLTKKIPFRELVKARKEQAASAASAALVSPVLPPIQNSWSTQSIRSSSKSERQPLHSFHRIGSLRKAGTAALSRLRGLGTGGGHAPNPIFDQRQRHSVSDIDIPHLSSFSRSGAQQGSVKQSTGKGGKAFIQILITQLLEDAENYLLIYFLCVSSFQKFSCVVRLYFGIWLYV